MLLRRLGGPAVHAAGLGCALALAACAGLAPERPTSSVIFPPPRASFEAAVPSLGIPNIPVSSFPFPFSSWMQDTA